MKHNRTLRRQNGECVGPLVTRWKAATCFDDEMLPMSRYLLPHTGIEDKLDLLLGADAQYLRQNDGAISYRH